MVTRVGQSPFPVDPSNPIASEVIDLERQKRLADILTQRGMQSPQGQVVGGRFVKPAWSQYANQMLSAYLGGAESRDVARQQQTLAQKLRQQGIEETTGIMQALTGTPAQQQILGNQIPESMLPRGQTAVTDEGDATLVQAERAAQSPNARLALARALSAETPTGRALLPSVMERAMPKDFDLTEGQVRFRINPETGKPEQIAAGTEKFRAPIQLDTGVSIEIRDAKDPSKLLQVIPKSLSMKDRAELADKGIIVGGQPSGGMPMGGGQSNAKVTGDAKYIPANLPTYEYDPDLSPAQNREAQGKFAEDLRKNVKNAKDAFDTLKSASQILSSGLPSSGRLENISTGVKEFFGSESEAAKQDSKLTILAKKLTQQVPRFEGPQSNVDVASYEAAAGDLGNANKTVGARLAAAQTLIDLNKKYYPSGDWESIDTSGIVRSKNIFGGTRGLGAKNLPPEEFAKGLSPIDQEAFKFVRANPKDPRTPEIKKRLGID
jgi:hypothetical protein